MEEAAILESEVRYSISVGLKGIPPSLLPNPMMPMVRWTLMIGMTRSILFS